MGNCDHFHLDLFACGGKKVCENKRKSVCDTTSLFFEFDLFIYCLEWHTKAPFKTLQTNLIKRNERRRYVFNFLICVMTSIVFHKHFSIAILYTFLIAVLDTYEEAINEDDEMDEVEDDEMNSELPDITLKPVFSALTAQEVNEGK
jgi:hypothetical protein